MGEGLIKTNSVLNGYFYSFDYVPPKPKMGYDFTPFVYVIGPSTRSLNNFIGINLHHLPIKQREDFIINLQKRYNFMEVGRCVLSEAELSNLLRGSTIAIREYNKTNITNCVRIDSKFVPDYINNSRGHLLQADSDYTLKKWLIEQQIYKQKEYK